MGTEGDEGGEEGRKGAVWLGGPEDVGARVRDRGHHDRDGHGPRTTSADASRGGPCGDRQECGHDDGGGPQASIGVPEESEGALGEERIERQLDEVVVAGPGDAARDGPSQACAPRIGDRPVADQVVGGDDVPSAGRGDAGGEE